VLDPEARRPAGPALPALTAAILMVWLLVVVFTSTHHELWRDEVRAISLVRAAATPADLYDLIEYDGHPVLWYLLLYLGTAIVDTPLVLPITGILVAFAAVTLFMIAAPFPFWMRSLFIFSGLPLYEYSVMARNYGISMLLLFLAAVAWRDRAKHPVRLGLVLALLANTNVHSVILVGLIAAIWAWDIAVEARRIGRRTASGPVLLAFALIAGGILLSAAFAAPRENTILTSVHRSWSLAELARAFAGALVRPDNTFADLVPESLPAPAAALVLYVAVLGLLRRPSLFLAAVAAQVVLGMFFRIAYPGSYRHQGLYLLFLVFLYWVFIEVRERRTALDTEHVLFKAGLYAGILMLIIANVGEARHLVLSDMRMERSSSKAFGAFLRESDQYREAVIVAEPDYMMESLPYYAGNPIYIARERRYGDTVAWTTASRATLTLGELLASARDVRSTQAGRPVLIVLAWNLDRRSAAGEREYIYGRVFGWTAEDLADFRQSTDLVAEFDAAYGDENYRVYVLK